MDVNEIVGMAKEHCDLVNHYAEYQNSYVFSYDDGTDRETFGGYGAPMIVPKDGSGCYAFLYGITQDRSLLAGGILREGSIEQLLSK